MDDWKLDRSTLYRNGIGVLLLVAVALVVHNIFGQNGYLTARGQQKKIHSLQEKMQDLQQENQRLDKENRALKSDPAAIERQAREQMHLAKPGEKIYTLPERAPASPPHPASKETSP
jgi:cell division protein FtsL